MRIISAGDAGFTYGGRFTGAVRLEMLREARTATEPDIARVHFSDGAITNWHAHPGGQLLFLVSGVGRVGSASDGETAGIRPGTLVETPDDERHWHGADDGHDAVWLATTWGATVWETASPL